MSYLTGSSIRPYIMDVSMLLCNFLKTGYFGDAAGQWSFHGVVLLQCCCLAHMYEMLLFMSCFWDADGQVMCWIVVSIDQRHFMVMLSQFGISRCLFWHAVVAGMLLVNSFCCSWCHAIVTHFWCFWSRVPLLLFVNSASQVMLFYVVCDAASHVMSFLIMLPVFFMVLFNAASHV